MAVGLGYVGETRTRYSVIACCWALGMSLPMKYVTAVVHKVTNVYLQ
jgi:hypothetical protein